MPHWPDIGVLALVPERFDVPWMSRHQILTRLARWYSVAWLNPTLEWREALRGRPSAPAPGSIAPPPGLRVCEPEPWLPRFYRPEWLARATDAARLRRARRALRRAGAEAVVLHVWRPGFLPALDRVAHDACLYHVVDEYTFSDRDLPVPDEERELLSRADEVIIHSPGLLEKKGGFNPNTWTIPNGVDFEAVSAEGPEPDDLADIPRPRLGYCGWLKNQLDWGLLRSLAERHPGWSFVFAGAPAPHPELRAVLAELDRLPNVHFLGSKRSDELMRYPRHFDVCLMPYRITAYTNCIYPLKLHEYLASGRPVVGTPIRTLRDFAHVVGIAEGVEAWSTALEAALSAEADSPAAVERRVAVARRHDWDRIAHRVARVIAHGVGPEAVRRFDALPVPEAWRADPPDVPVGGPHGSGSVR
jgi:glycosyltransferase involved in cell wall biosynthesis